MNDELDREPPIEPTDRSPVGLDEGDTRIARETPVASKGTRRRWWPLVVGVVCALVLFGYLVYPQVIRGFFFPNTVQGRNGTETGNGTARQAVGTSGGTQGGGAGRGGRGGMMGPVPVTAARAHLGDLPIYLNGLGSVVASETVTVRTRVDGQLLRVLFREGQVVKSGDLLAEIDPRPYLVQLTQAQGQSAKDEAALKNAQLDLARYQALLAKDAISKQQVDTQVATVNQSAGAVESDRGAIEAAKLNLLYTRITSPVDGRVGLRQVDPGNMVHAADPNGIVVVTRVRPINVLFTLPADQLQQVLQNFRAQHRLVVEAWDRDLTTRLATGSLLSTDNEIDPTTGTVRMKAVFSNDNDELFPNQFVNARLLVDTIRGAVLVPSAAIQRSPEGSYVWVVGGDGTVQMRTCEVGVSEGDQSAIARGVADGDLVVTDGVDRLQQGTKVRAQMAAGRGGARGAPNGPGAGPRGANPVQPQPPSGQAAPRGGRRQ